MKYYEYIVLYLIVEEKGKNKFIYNKTWLINIDIMSELQFYENFRMSKNKFYGLVEYIRDNSPKHLNNIFLQVSVFVFYVSHPCTFRKIREIFGISKSFIWTIVMRMSEIFYSIAKKEIKLPEENEFAELKQNFHLKGNLPNTVLAIDGTHVPIHRPRENPALYYNRKSFYSINFSCAVDCFMCFRYVAFGFGSAHDSRIFRNSSLRNFSERIYFVGLNVVADSAFKSFSGVLTPASSENEELNSNVEKQRVLVENSFGLFKGKFKRFSTPIYNGEKTIYIKMIIGSL